MKKELILTTLIVLATLMLAACSPRVTTTILSPEEEAAYAAEVDDIVENMLVGWSECDHAMVIRDYVETWKENSDESGFSRNATSSSVQLAHTISKTLDHVVDNPGLPARIAIYHVVFENDPNVTLFVYFGIDDPNHRIIGLEFQDWQKLREANGATVPAAPDGEKTCYLFSAETSNEIVKADVSTGMSSNSLSVEMNLDVGQLIFRLSSPDGQVQWEEAFLPAWSPSWLIYCRFYPIG